MPDFIASRQTLLLYLKARIPFISLRTDERDRALDLTRGLASQLNIAIYYHTLSQGVREVVSNRVVNEDRSVAGALDYASQQILQRQNLTFVLTETQDLSDDTPVSRQLLDVAASATERGGCIIVITTSRSGRGCSGRGCPSPSIRQMKTRCRRSSLNACDRIVAECRSNGRTPNVGSRRDSRRRNARRGGERDRRASGERTITEPISPS